MANKGVLIVEDEFLIAEVLSAMIEDMGLQVCGTAATADDAIALAERCSPILVLMDVRLKGIKDGVDAARAIRPMLSAPIIFITGSREPATVERIGPDQVVLFKPFQFEQLKDLVQQALEAGSDQPRPH